MSIGLRNSRFRLPQRRPENVNINDLASRSLLPNTSPATECQTVFGVGDIVDRRADGVTVVRIRSNNMLAYLQSGSAAAPFTTDFEKLKSKSAGKKKASHSNAQIDGERYIIHHVTPSDTLQGVCLRYNTTLKILKRFNDFPSKNISVCDVLKIPAGEVEGQSPEKSQMHSPMQASPAALTPTHRYRMALAVVRGVSLARLTLDVADAKAYLEMHNWKIEKATQAATSDLKWEAEEDKRRERQRQKTAEFEKEERLTQDRQQKEEAQRKRAKESQGHNHHYQHMGGQGMACVPLGLAFRIRRVFTGLF